MTPQGGERIALTVVGGFLGAGKTTLLNHVLSASRRRAAVLVNDFGPVDIDAGLIAQRSDQVIRLANGCVCCSMAGGLDDALARVLALDPLPEWIVIEASGVSDPGRIAQVGMADPMLQLEGVVVLADAANVRTLAQDPLLADTLLRQLRAADLLVLNKTDLVSDEERASVRQWLHAASQGAAMMEAREGRVDLGHLLGEGAAGHFAPHDCAGGACGHPAHHLTQPPTHQPTHQPTHPPTQPRGGLQDDPDHPFQSWLWRAPALVDADRLASRLREAPRQLLRAKGWVRTDRHGLVLVQLAGRRVRYDTQARPPPDVQEPALVLIGMRGAVDPGEVAAWLAPAAA
ncbi:CobW family GTP-binding protein [Achromobacter anxifer]|uniref:Metal chaperone YciC n=1 Tax=Achromobacter anxifer TaxID=1287737 RepID=A0A6S7E6D2_9BURK|nr:CobW family GTP-binding protein [Achromobacter anxifer]CAB3897467.1 Putative metal chaperone YciC [Achromobacter anxifer]CAB5515566.1 Putative metal chaperone YciC [Achromobacter anxifer]